MKYLALLVWLVLSFGAHAAAPTVVTGSVTESGSLGATGATAYTINMPASGLQAGDLCIFIAASDGGGDFFSNIANYLDFDNNVQFYTGTDATYNHGAGAFMASWSPCSDANHSGSFTLGMSSTEQGAMFIIPIRGWDGTTAPNFSAHDATAGINAGCDSPAVTTWNGVDAIVIWVTAIDAANRTISAYPTGFTDNQTGDTINETEDLLYFATTTTSGASVDPANATYNTTVEGVCYAIAVTAAGAGGGGSLPLRRRHE
jgi:hypothetical protein